MFVLIANIGIKTYVTHRVPTIILLPCLGLVLICVFNNFNNDPDYTLGHRENTTTPIKIVGKTIIIINTPHQLQYRVTVHGYCHKFSFKKMHFFNIAYMTISAFVSSYQVQFIIYEEARIMSLFTEKPIINITAIDNVITLTTDMPRCKQIWE